MSGVSGTPAPGLGGAPQPLAGANLPGVPKLIVKLGSDNTPERGDSPGEAYHHDQHIHTDHQQYHYHHRHKEKKKKKKKDKKKRDDKERGENINSSSRDHHRHHKKKKRREYEGEEVVRAASSSHSHDVQPVQHQPYFHPQSSQDGSDLGPPPNKVAKLESDSDVGSVNSGMGSVVSGGALSPKRDPTTKTSASTQKQSCYMFCKVLEHLLVMLERKDVSNFFSQPVSDSLAPGYSQIIKQPMDFSTMNKKIQQVSYEHLNQFREDFELICNNCMVYNTPDTVYHKAAKRLLHQGQRLLAPDRIRALADHIPLIQELTHDQLGFDIKTELPADITPEDEKDISKVIQQIRGSIRRPPGRFEAIPDNMTPEQIANQARNAANSAAERLHKRKPGSNMGYLRQKADGTTSLAFITPAMAAAGGDKTVTLGQLIGRVKNGASTLQGFKEDRRNCVKAFNPIYYGAFSSYGPAYDSTFANLTKQETELVYSTYGDEVGVAYAESIKNFSKNCEYATFLVDHLLGILTGNEHKKTSKIVEEAKLLRSEESLVKSAFDTNSDSFSNNKESQPTVDFDSLRTLAKDGIDMSFLEGLQSQYLQNGATSVKLEKNAALLESLRDVQYERLSGQPPQHLGQISGPSAEESSLSERIQQNLVSLVADHAPKDVFVQGGAGGPRS